MKKILIAEDQADIRKLLRMTLESSAYEVMEAPTGDEAWALAQRSQRLDRGIATVFDHVAQRVLPIHRAGNLQVFREAFDGERGTRVVVAQRTTGLAQQLIDRHIAGRHAQQVTVQHLALVGDAALADDTAHIHAGDMQAALVGERFVHRMLQVHHDALGLHRRQQCR